MMQHITRIACNQMVFTSLEYPISEDNSVRFICAFLKKTSVIWHAVN